MVILCFLFILFFYKIKVSSSHNINLEEILSLRNSICIKGFLAFIIMSGHIASVLNIHWLIILEKVGVLAASIFFFLSGYGLMISYRTKENYLNGFLKKHLLKLLIPCLIAYIFQTILFYLLHLCGIEIYGVYTLLTFINWFVYIILLCYLLFYLCYKYNEKFNSHNANIAILILLSCFMICCFIFKVNRLFWGGVLSFPIGLFMAENYTGYSKKLSQWRNVILPVSIIIFMLFNIAFIKCGEYSLWGDLIGRNMSTTIAIILFLYIFNVFFINNKLCYFLGKISYELYIVHFIYTRIFLGHEDISVHPEIYSLLIIILSILTAYILSICNKWTVSTLCKINIS